MRPLWYGKYEYITTYNVKMCVLCVVFFSPLVFGTNVYERANEPTNQRTNAANYTRIGARADYKFKK